MPTASHRYKRLASTLPYRIFTMQYNYTELTFRQIRLLAHDLGIKVTREHGKLSARQTWIDTIESHMSVQLSAEVADPEFDPEFDVLEPDSDHLEPNSDHLEPTPIKGLDDVGVIDYANPGQTSPVTTSQAVTVFATFLVVLSVAIYSLLAGACAIARLAVLFASMFGRYNPDLDLWYQLELLAAKRYELAEGRI